MSANSKIEWCDRTWNPVTGCSKVSDGCKFCYAEPIFKRMSKNPSTPAYHDRRFQDVRFHPDRLEEPLRWKKPSIVFVNSMSDLFHEHLPSDEVIEVFRIMAEARQHYFLILTKRPRQMKWFFEEHPSGPTGEGWPLPNVGLGVSVEDQATADERIPILLETPAAVRFVSYEPALGLVDFRRMHIEDVNDGVIMNPLSGYTTGDGCYEPWIDHQNRIDWVIAGGESGPNARPSHPDWFRSVRDQCQAAGVPFFFKQWGEWMPLDDWRRRPPDPEGPTITYIPEERISWIGSEPIESCKAETLMGVCRVGKKTAGRLLDGREWNEFPAIDHPAIAKRLDEVSRTEASEVDRKSGAGAG